MNREYAHPLVRVLPSLGLLVLAAGLGFPSRALGVTAADVNAVQALWAWDTNCHRDSWARFPDFTEEAAASRAAFVRKCRRYAAGLRPVMPDRWLSGLDDSYDPFKFFDPSRP